MRHEPAEVPLAADRSDSAPLTSQVADQLREAMRDGRLAAGERLPSTRALAAVLGVSRTVATGAYAQLFAEGWIEGRHGSGTYVAQGVPTGTADGLPGGWPSQPATDEPPAGGLPAGEPPSDEPPADGLPAGEPPAGEHGAARSHGVPGHAAPGEPTGLIDLRPGIPWTAGIDLAAWRRAWRGVGTVVPPTMPEALGTAELRAAVTWYLRRSRAVTCDPAQVLVTRGVAGGLSLIAATMLGPGALVGVEEPGYPTARAVLAAYGATVVPCRVDTHGLVVEDLPPGLAAVYTTPAHQYPLGGRLPVPRRVALVEWARRTGALILEDDYDGEFRYDVAPLPPMFGLGPEVVVYLGTTTKTLTPALRLGWLVAEPALARRLAEAATAAGDWPSWPVQHAVTELVTSGELERHVRRMRHEYARRRAVMVGALKGCGPGLLLLGDEAGMHVVLQTGPGAGALAAAAASRGVAVYTLDRYYAGAGDRDGLVLGYGAASLDDVTRGCQLLAEALTGSVAPL